MKKRIFSFITSFLMILSTITYFPTITASALSNEETIYNFLKSECGLNTAAACGVLANIEKESNFNPDLIEGGYTWSSGGGYGICQWTNSDRTSSSGRRTNLVNWCSSNGYNYKTIDGQLHFLKHELETSYTGVYNHLKNVSNDGNGAYSAGYKWCYSFEVPAGYDKGVSVTRGNLAQSKYWPKYSNQNRIDTEVDNSYNKNVPCTAPSKINTYDAYGNKESDRWVDAGDPCIAIEAYTSGYWKIDYPASGSRRIAYMNLSEWNPFENTILPGTVDTKYKTNVSCTAPSKINTYDANGNRESDRWVDAGDSCIAIEAYTNGYWKIDYPASGSRRIAYMKLSEWNPFASIILPGTVDSKYSKNVSCTAQSQIHTYDERWVDAGDSCIAIEAYTNGYWKIDYPASGSRRIAYMKLSEWNPFENTILPGTVDTKYKTNISCTAPSQINTYDANGNRESNRWVDAGDSCIAIEAYTNGYWKIDYPAGSTRRIAYMKLSEWNPFTNAWIVDTRYNTNVSCTAPSQIHTYDSNGNQESNRWVDPGDSCIAIEAYTNGFWKIDYPAGSVRRIAYMKLSEWNPFVVHTHSYTSRVTKEATCTVSGVRTYSCSCGDTYTETIPAPGHDYTVKTVAPTTTAMGYDLHTCKVCNYSFKDNYTDIVHTHSYTSEVTKEPSCTATGITTYSCSCGDSFTEIISATGHTYTVKTIAPTETSQGYDLHTCTVCNHSYKDNFTDIVVHTHSYTEKITKAATCTEDGIKTYTCSCGKSYNEVIKATGHKYIVKTVPPTETEAGYDQHTCSVCGKFYIDNVVAPGTVVNAKNPVVSYEKGDGCVKLTWTAISGADKYAVYGYMNNKWKSIAQGSGTSYTLKGLTAGKNYKVVVIARFNGTWNTKDISKAIVVTPKEKAVPEYPVVTSRSVSGNAFQIKWTAVKNAESYGIARYSSGKWVLVDDKIPAGTTTYTKKNVPAGTYTMVVCAKVNGKWDTSNLESRAFKIAV